MMPTMLNGFHYTHKQMNGLPNLLLLFLLVHISPTLQSNRLECKLCHSRHLGPQAVFDITCEDHPEDRDVPSSPDDYYIEVPGPGTPLPGPAPSQGEAKHYYSMCVSQMELTKPPPGTPKDYEYIGRGKLRTYREPNRTHYCYIDYNNAPDSYFRVRCVCDWPNCNLTPYEVLREKLTEDPLKTMTLGEGPAYWQRAVEHWEPGFFTTDEDANESTWLPSSSSSLVFSFSIVVALRKWIEVEGMSFF